MPVEYMICDAETHGAGCPKWCDYRPGGSTKPVPYSAKATTTFDPPDHAVIDARGSRYDGQPVPFARDPQSDPARPALDRVLEEARATEGIAALLRLMGEDSMRDGLVDTPARVVKAYLELADRPGDVASLLAKQFPEGPDNGEMVTVHGIEFVSICEHHLLPFVGTATVAYIPASPMVVGLSKIPRVLHHFARRPQVQERLTGQVTAALDEHLTTHGSACRIESTHQCMSLRGVRSSGASMVTTSLTGRFLEDARTRSEFLAEAQR